MVNDWAIKTITKHFTDHRRRQPCNQRPNSPEALILPLLNLWNRSLHECEIYIIFFKLLRSICKAHNETNYVVSFYRFWNRSLHECEIYIILFKLLRSICLVHNETNYVIPFYVVKPKSCFRTFENVVQREFDKVGIKMSRWGWKKILISEFTVLVITIH